MRKLLTDLNRGFLVIKVKTQLFKEDENTQIIQEQFLLLLRDPPFHRCTPNEKDDRATTIPSNIVRASQLPLLTSWHPRLLQSSTQ